MKKMLNARKNIPRELKRTRTVSFFSVVRGNTMRTMSAAHCGLAAHSAYAEENRWAGILRDAPKLDDEAVSCPRMSSPDAVWYGGACTSLKFLPPAVSVGAVQWP